MSGKEACFCFFLAGKTALSESVGLWERERDTERIGYEEHEALSVLRAWLNI